MLMFVSLVLYMLCCAVSYGATFAYFQKTYPELALRDNEMDKMFSIGVSVLGPVSLICVAILSGFFHKGFKFK